jgi:hypothetical protein
MSAAEALTAATRHGVKVRLDGENLTLEAATAPPDAVIAAIKQNKPEIVALLRAPAGHPAPRITANPPFGSDGVLERFRAAWEELLARRPPAVDPFVWSAAIFGTADLFGWWSAELDRLHWPAAAIIAIPHDGKAGLAWFLNGEHVVALGPERAFLQDGRIFDRRLMALVDPETDGLPMTRERLPN